MTDTTPTARIGHVHLKFADLDRAIEFYSGVPGFELRQRFGAGAALLSTGGYHHHIGLNIWESLGATPPPPGRTGLYHTAILYPCRPSLADAVARVLATRLPLTGAADHGVSDAVHLKDPDGNGVELYRDKPESDWPRDIDRRPRVTNAPLDLKEILAAGPKTAAR